MNFNNQRRIVIHRENVSNNSQRLFLAAYKDNIVDAMNNLTPSAFKVYLLLLMNRDNYGLWLSPAYLGKQADIHRDTARKATYELEKKGYIRHREDDTYDFYESPNLYISQKD